LSLVSPTNPYRPSLFLACLLFSRILLLRPRFRCQTSSTLPLFTSFLSISPRGLRTSLYIIFLKLPRGRPLLYGKQPANDIMQGDVLFFFLFFSSLLLGSVVFLQALFLHFSCRSLVIFDPRDVTIFSYWMFVASPPFSRKGRLPSNRRFVSPPLNSSGSCCRGPGSPGAALCVAQSQIGVRFLYPFLIVVPVFLFSRIFPYIYAFLFVKVDLNPFRPVLFVFFSLSPQFSPPAASPFFHPFDPFLVRAAFPPFYGAFEGLHSFFPFHVAYNSVLG